MSVFTSLVEQRCLAGQFIVIEGIDGCGKGEVINHLNNDFSAAGADVLLVREPGTTEVGDEIRDMLLHTRYATPLAPETQLLLFSAARAQLCREVIVPARQAGKLILSERFWPSTIAYQCGGDGVDEQKAKAVQQLVLVSGSAPDIVIVLDVPARMAMERTSHRGRALDNFESKGRDYYERVRKAYLALAIEEEDFQLVDGTGTPDQVYADVVRVFSESYLT